MSRLLTLDLSFGFHGSDNIVRLARVFKALSQCRVDLEDYYDKVCKLRSPRLSCLFPNPTPVDPSVTLPNLTYRYFLSRAGQPTSVIAKLGEATTAMYIATLKDGDDEDGDTNQDDDTDQKVDTNHDVIIKFTACYNKEAHHLLAQAGFAPKLYFCERVIGGLYMVVMEYVDGKSLWQLRRDKIPIPPIVPKQVEAALHLLHENDIVFGDLRDPNILYVKSKDCVALVDFDRPGKHGEDRYPATFNTENRMADRVNKYIVMLKDDDLSQLERLKEGLVI